MAVVLAKKTKKKKKNTKTMPYKEKHDPVEPTVDKNAAEENEYTKMCSECHKMAIHGSRALQFNLKNDQKPTLEGWQGVLRAGCGYEENNLCNRVLIKKYGAELADEMNDIFEMADGDGSDSSTEYAAVAASLCGHDSITEACPKGFHARFSAPPSFLPFF